MSGGSYKGALSRQGFWIPLPQTELSPCRPAHSELMEPHVHPRQPGHVLQSKSSGYLFQLCKYFDSFNEERC